MVTLVPVDHDPFADLPYGGGDGVQRAEVPAGVTRVTVRPQGRSYRLVPVDHDPFAEDLQQRSRLAARRSLSPLASLS